MPDPAVKATLISISLNSKELPCWRDGPQLSSPPPPRNGVEYFSISCLGSNGFMLVPSDIMGIPYTTNSFLDSPYPLVAASTWRDYGKLSYRYNNFFNSTLIRHSSWHIGQFKMFFPLLQTKISNVESTLIILHQGIHRFGDLWNHSLNRWRNPSHRLDRLWNLMPTTQQELCHYTSVFQSAQGLGVRV